MKKKGVKQKKFKIVNVDYMRDASYVNYLINRTKQPFPLRHRLSDALALETIKSSGATPQFSKESLLLNL
jgi:hypothetical protein